MAYIDAEKLCDNLRLMAKYQYPDKRNTILGVVSTIENTPTADVVEVVRCRDCTEWDKDECECSHWHGFRENDFCSFAERRDT